MDGGTGKLFTAAAGSLEGGIWHTLGDRPKKETRAGLAVTVAWQAGAALPQQLDSSKTGHGHSLATVRGDHGSNGQTCGFLGLVNGQFMHACRAAGPWLGKRPVHGLDGRRPKTAWRPAKRSHAEERSRPGRHHGHSWVAW